MNITELEVSPYMADRLNDETKIQHTLSQGLWRVKNFKIAKAGSTNKANFFFYKNTIHDDDFTSVNSPVGGIGDYIKFNSQVMVKIKDIAVMRVSEWVGVEYEGLKFKLGDKGFEGYDYKNRAYVASFKAGETLISTLACDQGERLTLDDWVWVIEFEHCTHLDQWLSNSEHDLLAQALKVDFNSLDIAIVSNEEYIEKFKKYNLLDKVESCQTCIKEMKVRQERLKALYERLMGYSMQQPAYDDCSDDVPF